MTLVGGYETEQYLLRYDAFIVTPGICHVVITRNGQLPKPNVLLGELDDNPSTSLTNALETAAHAVSEKLLGGETDFNLYEYVPRGLPSGKPTFYRIVWSGGRAFRWPTWNPVPPDEDDWLSAVKTLVRTTGYTSRNVSAPTIDATSSGRDTSFRAPQSSDEAQGHPDLPPGRGD